MEPLACLGGFHFLLHAAGEQENGLGASGGRPAILHVASTDTQRIAHRLSCGSGGWLGMANEPLGLRRGPLIKQGGFESRIVFRHVAGRAGRGFRAIWIPESCWEFQTQASRQNGSWVLTTGRKFNPAMR